MQDLGFGVLDVELDSLTSQGKDPYFMISPDCGSLWLGFGFFLGETFISVSPTCLNVFLLPFVMEALFVQF